jgi:betaine-aldehyde dehydrogenase
MTLHFPPTKLKQAPVNHEMLIDGKWIGAGDSEMLARVAPGHGSLVAHYVAGLVEDAEKAIVAARKAFDNGPWPKMSAAERSRIIHRIADLIAENKDQLARLDAIESGKPITQVRSEIDGAVDIWRYAATLARTLYGESYNNLGEQTLGLVLREAIGVVSIITPWNFPFLIVSQKLPFALAAGCTTVVKPSELSSSSTLELGRLCAEAGVPDGVVNIITGKGSVIGNVMTSHSMVDMVSFTGSTVVGQLAMSQASHTLKKVSLELGGKNPQIVFPDADLDAFVDAAVFGGFFNAGECCNAGSRLLVHESLFPEILDRLVAHAKCLRIGDPLHEATQVGAIITPDHLQKIEGFIGDAIRSGAHLALGGKQLDLGAGQYLEPTIVADVRPEMPIACAEVFGPVISVQKFGTIQEAVTMANASNYGLSASVWSKNIDTCVEVARGTRAGTIWVNTYMDGTPELPFGGMKQSGLGRELGRHAVEDYTESKTLNIHTGSRTAWWVRP